MLYSQKNQTMENELLSPAEKPHGMSSSYEKKSSILALFAALTAINNILFFTPGINGVLYYGLIAVFLAAALCGGGRLQLNLEMWMVYSACWLSIFLNDIPAVFHAGYRCLSFMLVTLLLASGITSEFFVVFRVKLLRYLLNGCIVVTVLSFIGTAVGFSARLPSSGFWCGLTTHPMLLGVVSGVAAITLFYDFLTIKKRNRFFIFYHCIALIASIFCLFGAAARTSIIASVSGLFILAVRKRSILKIVLLIVICTLAGLISGISGGSMLGMVMKKNDHQNLLHFDSRRELWQQRIREFQSNPFCGIGFSRLEEGKTGSQVSADGKIESGSSWLLILSSTGIMGILAVMFLLNQTLKQLSRIRQNDFGNLLTALSVFWALEMCAEGFVFASGSFLFFLFWSLMGAIQGAAAEHKESSAELFDFESRKIREGSS